MENSKIDLYLQFFLQNSKSPENTCGYHVNGWQMGTVHLSTPAGFVQYEHSLSCSVVKRLFTFYINKQNSLVI